MLLQTAAAYSEHGLRLRIGDPGRLYSCLLRGDAESSFQTGGGMSVTDAYMFMTISRHLTPSTVFVIGNACGISTLSLAEIFPMATVDAIDNETEGPDSHWGTELTRAIAHKYFPKVNVTVGSSPQQLKEAMRAGSYDLVFVDGLHTNEQVRLDYHGVKPFLSERCVVVFHDVALTRMEVSWNKIKLDAAASGFSGFDATFTQFGSGILSRNVPDLESFLTLTCGSFSDISAGYHLGVPPRGILDLSLRRAYRGIRYRLKL